MHRYTDGNVLAEEKDFNKHMRSKYGAPFIDVHRADVQQLLHKKALELGVQIRTSARVANIDQSRPSVLLETDEEILADLVVGADGLWSQCRETLLGRPDKPLATGDLAYRIVLHLDDISDPELRTWIAKPACHFWIGPYAHAVGYSMRSGTMYNLVLLCPDDLPADVARYITSPY